MNIPNDVIAQLIDHGIIEEKHISEITNGDTIIHNNIMKTVSDNDFK